MDDISSQDKNRFLKIVLSFVAVFLLGVCSSLAFTYFTLPREPRQKTSIKCDKTTAAPPVECEVKAEELPIGTALLKNPLVYEWRGSIEGKLVEKDEHTFIVEDGKGNRITITDITPSGVVFKTIFERKTKEGFVKTSLKEIPIGTKLRGDFWIMKGGKNTPVGGSFEIIEE